MVVGAAFVNEDVAPGVNVIRDLCDATVFAIPFAGQDAVGAPGKKRPRHDFNRIAPAIRQHGHGLSCRRHSADAKSPCARLEVSKPHSDAIHHHAVKRRKIVIGGDVLPENSASRQVERTAHRGKRFAQKKNPLPGFSG